MNSKVFSGDVGQLAEVIRTVVQEELSDFKKDMRRSLRDEVDDMVDQLHRDIINLQAEMLIQFQLHQVRYKNYKFQNMNIITCNKHYAC